MARWMMRIERGRGKTASLALCLALAAGCGSKPSYYRNDMAAVEPGSRVAALPFVNLTKDVHAPDVVMNAFLVEFLATNRFTVADPGVVDDVIQQERIRPQIAGESQAGDVGSEEQGVALSPGVLRQGPEEVRLRVADDLDAHFRLNQLHGYLLATAG